MPDAADADLDLSVPPAAAGPPLAIAVPTTRDEVDVVRSSRARRVSVRVDRMTGAVRITLPQRAPLSEVERALSRHRRWLAARLAEVAVVRAAVDARGDVLSVWGEELTLVREPGRSRVHRKGHALHVPAGDDGAALERWLRARAREHLVPLTEQAAAALGRSVARVSIGDARSRWGSCSAKRTITYSWRLVLAPPWVAEAIVWHEACHLVELNHSDRFWSLLRRHEPRTDESRRWLRAHGATLVVPSAPR
ncbi:MAG: M48 family metallopeptidase [Solirubrobacteraceae bacterium]|nr:M48 family metallopeptidase [Solirubrobacteraceae bacterium]